MFLVKNVWIFCNVQSPPSCCKALNPHSSPFPHRDLYRNSLHTRVPWQDKALSITKTTDLNHIKILFFFLLSTYAKEEHSLASCRPVLLLLLPFKEALQNGLQNFSLYCSKPESLLTLPLKYKAHLQ